MRHRGSALVAVLATVLAMSACGTLYDHNAEIPADAWPTLEGVTVVSSRGFEGQDCCDTHHTGGRVVALRTSVTASEAIDFVASRLRDMGWRSYECTHKTVCLHHDGMLGVFRTPDAAQLRRGIEVMLWLERDPAAIG